MPIKEKAKGGDDFRKVYEWFKPRNPQYIQIGNDKLSRDLLINYLRNIDVLKGSKYYDENNLRLRVVNNE